MTQGEISPRKDGFYIQWFLHSPGGPPAALVSAQSFCSVLDALQIPVLEEAEGKS